MGVDTKILLPAAARIQDVADVMGALAGFPMEKRYFAHIRENGRDSAGWSAGHPYGSSYVRLTPIHNMVQCAYIHLDSSELGRVMVDGEREHQCMYHFEAGCNGERLLMPRSTDFWIAIGKGLVEFFGGTVDYNDCDDSDVDFARPAQKDIHAEDGAEWYSMQARKLVVKPLTQVDLDAARKVASYA